MLYNQMCAPPMGLPEDSDTAYRRGFLFLQGRRQLLATKLDSTLTTRRTCNQPRSVSHARYQSSLGT